MRGLVLILHLSPAHRRAALALTSIVLAACYTLETSPRHEVAVAPGQFAGESCPVDGLDALRSGEEQVWSFRLTAQAEAVAERYEQACMAGQTCACREALAYWRWARSAPQRIQFPMDGDRARSSQVAPAASRADKAIGRLLPRLMQLEHDAAQAAQSHARWKQVQTEFPNTELARVAAYNIESLAIRDIDRAIRDLGSSWQTLWLPLLNDANTPVRVLQHIDGQIAAMANQDLKARQIDHDAAIALVLWANEALPSNRSSATLIGLLERDPVPVAPTGPFAWHFENEQLVATGPCDGNILPGTFSGPITKTAPLGRLLDLAPAVFTRSTTSNADLRFVPMTFDVLQWNAQAGVDSVAALGAPTATVAENPTTPRCTARWNTSTEATTDNWLSFPWASLSWRDERQNAALLAMLAQITATHTDERLTVLASGATLSEVPNLDQALESYDVARIVRTVFGSDTFETLTRLCQSAGDDESCQTFANLSNRITSGVRTELEQRAREEVARVKASSTCDTDEIRIDSGSDAVAVVESQCLNPSYTALLNVVGSAKNLCTNTCRFARDNDCDDDGDTCAYGTDCADCGTRTRPAGIFATPALERELEQFKASQVAVVRPLIAAAVREQRRIEAEERREEAAARAASSRCLSACRSSVVACDGNPSWCGNQCGRGHRICPCCRPSTNECERECR